MSNGLLRYRMEIAGFILGAVAGWCYWYFVGCASGSCPITSSPYITTIYGAVMGSLLGSMGNKKNTKVNEK